MRALLGRIFVIGSLVTGLGTVGVAVAGAASAALTDTLLAGQQLNVGDSLVSTDGRYTAAMQTDGNFVVYGPSGAGWNTGVSSAIYIAMQTDGNLVAYDAIGGYTWSSSTAPSYNDRLVMQSDGNLVIYSGDGVALWSNGNRIPGAGILLTNTQRQAYLNYYAPVIFKRGNENNGGLGRDWLTNFDFDQDHNFATNRVNWLNVNQYAAASAANATTSPYAAWRIRPTLYTSLIEYTSAGVKSLVLLYHVYNAADKQGSQIHDWERIEIVVRNATGTPGATDEYVNNSTITHHSEHIIRKRGDFGFNFMNTATGKHLMIWQADEAGSVLATHAHELRYSNDSYSSIASQPSTNNAEVEISGKDVNENVHYIFIPQASSAAVSAWGAKPLNFSNASTLTSGYDNENTVDWYQAKRLTYELQDIADITPTHWSGNPAWPTHWLSDTADDIVLESPVLNETGVAEVPAGLQRFYTRSRDNGASDLTDGRKGVLHKDWFYGAYSAEADEDWPDGTDELQGYEGVGTDSSGWTRQMASGRYDSPNSYWWQHDFFAHDGTVDTGSTTENGQWLRGAWYTAAGGGFDGRWVQLFDDRPGLEP